MSNSKVFFPTMKGTELWPTAMPKPPVLRIHGTEPGSPEERAILDRFGGAISQFHGKQAQNYALSNLPITRGHLNLPHLGVRYTNLQGQEYIDVMPSPEILAQLPRSYWIPIPRWRLVRAGGFTGDPRNYIDYIGINDIRIRSEGAALLGGIGEANWWMHFQYELPFTFPAHELKIYAGGVGNFSRIGGRRGPWWMMYIEEPGVVDENTPVGEDPDPIWKWLAENYVGQFDLNSVAEENQLVTLPVAPVTLETSARAYEGNNLNELGLVARPGGGGVINMIVGSSQIGVWGGSLRSTTVSTENGGPINFDDLNMVWNWDAAGSGPLWDSVLDAHTTISADTAYSTLGVWGPVRLFTSDEGWFFDSYHPGGFGEDAFVPFDPEARFFTFVTVVDGGEDYPPATGIEELFIGTDLSGDYDGWYSFSDGGALFQRVTLEGVAGILHIHEMFRAPQPITIGAQEGTYLEIWMRPMPDDEKLGSFEVPL